MLIVLSFKVYIKNILIPKVVLNIEWGFTNIYLFVLFYYLCLWNILAISGSYI
jgi:hypothetical protein